MLKTEQKNYYKEIYYGEIHVATHVKPKYAPMNLSFVTDDSKFLQLGMWNYPKGKELDNHFHKKFERSSFRTNEFVYVVRGKIKCDLYTEDGVFITTVIVKKGEGILQHNFAHKYTILKKSIIIETKNGPYFGVEKDKQVINEK